jgi:phospholipase D1/2
MDTPNGPILGMNVVTNDAETFGTARIGFKLPIPKTATSKSLAYNIPSSQQAQQNEGAFWEIQAQLIDPPVNSPVFSVARVNRALTVRAGKKVATYNWHAGNDIVFYNDGSTDSEGSAGAFADMAVAIDEAQNFIFIADWSFHPYARLHHKDPPTIASTIGMKLINKAKNNPNMLIAIHTWDHTVGADDDQNDDALGLLDDLAGGKRPSNLLWRASSRTGEGGGPGIGWSHHQKYLIADTAGPGSRRKIKAFIGGLDLTKGRFDWPEHVINVAKHFQENIPGHVVSGGKATPQNYDDWYNAEFEGCKPVGDLTKPRQPWHDIHCQVVGPTAWDLVREFVGRWNLDPTLTPTKGDKSDAAITQVDNLFTSLFAKTGDVFNFVLPFEPPTGPWAAQVYRSIVKEHWGSKTKIVSPMLPDGEFQWTIDSDVERSIQDAYLQAIGQAENFIYIESQYFIGSGKKWGRGGVANTVPEAIANRINQHISNHHLEFHAYIVIPMFPEGDPTSSAAKAQRQFEWKTIQFMIQLVQAKCEEFNTKNADDPNAETLSWDKFLSFYFLANWDDLGTKTLKLDGSRTERLAANPRYMIYVHSKMIIIDDRYAIIGSANLNERSLNGGRDTEICVGMWPGNDKQLPTCVAQLKQFRKNLWLEHFGPNMTTLIPDWERPQFASGQTVLAARINYDAMRQCLRRAAPPAIKSAADIGHICNWPFALNANGRMIVEKTGRYSGKDFEHLPDGPDGVSDLGAWRLDPSFFTLAGVSDVPE